MHQISAAEVLAQEKVLETLRSWSSDLHGKDIVGEVKTFESGKPGPDIIEEVYLSEDERTCVARRYLVVNGVRHPTDIFGVVAKQHLSAQWSYIESGESGGVISQKDGSSMDSICLFLNDFAARHLFLRSLAMGAELFPLIESRKDWSAREEGQNVVYQSGAGDGELLLTVSKDNAAWPIFIAHQWTIRSQASTYSTQLELKFSDPTRFEGVEQELPGLTTAKLQMDGDFKAQFEDVFKLVSVKKRVNEIKSWPDAITEMPNGLAVTVEHLPQIEFEWQNNDIVRSIDRKKLSELSQARFIGGSRVFIIAGVLLFGIAAMIIFARTRRP